MLPNHRGHRSRAVPFVLPSTRHSRHVDAQPAKLARWKQPANNHEPSSDGEPVTLRSNLVEYGNLALHCSVCVNPHPTQEARELDDWSAYRAAAMHGDLAMLRCLKWLGYPLDACVFTSAATEDRCRVGVLRWMVEQGFPVDWEQVEEEDREARPAWRHKWGQRTLWIHTMWRQSRK